jgi:hypothetical protein
MQSVIKKFSILTFLLFEVVWFFSAESSEEMKVWIFFKDRPYLKNQNSMIQRIPFSEKAIERRLTRGSGGWNENDFLIEASYVENVKKAGAKVLLASRWLNAVSATCDSRCRTNLSKLTFISTLRPVGNYRRENAKISQNIQFMKASNNSADTLELEYGLSRDQLEQIKVIEAHVKGYAGQGETVAIMSTGFRKDHQAFRGKEIVGEYDFVHGDDNCSNGNPDWVGTATWSVIGGEFPGELYGPAYKSKVILVVTDELQNETSIEEDRWVAGFEFADQMGASVVDATLGHLDSYQTSDYDGMTSIASRIASTASKKGIVVTTCTGYYDKLLLPGDAFDILTVGLADAKGSIFPFSFKGRTADGRLKPEVIARGSKVYKASTSAPDAFTFFTSNVEPCSLVAGGAAVVLSARPDWNPLQVREAIMKTSSHADRPTIGYGYGNVNIAKAIDFLPANSVVIDHVPIKTQLHSGQPIKVTARIRAQNTLNLNQLNLFWKKQGMATYQQLKLTSVPGVEDNFQGFIPAQSKGTTILYYLSAKDMKGKKTKVPFGPGKSFQFTIS